MDEANLKITFHRNENGHIVFRAEGFDSTSTDELTRVFTRDVAEQARKLADHTEAGHKELGTNG